MSYADLITNLLLFFVVLLTAANLSKGKMQQIAKSLSGEQSPESLESIKAKIDKQIAERHLEELVRSKLGDDGLEISLNSGLAFDSGEAKIRPELEPVIESTLEVLAKYSAKYNYAVEGHTDSVPIMPGGTFPSNWELSAARA
ncbi:MAG TPA: flagellar motor protein MotB, partial [Myxococcota bacterium]